MRTTRFTHILITGASSGIGAALAHEFAAPGIILTLTGRNPERLQKIAQGCEKQGAQVVSLCVDVTDQNGMASLVRQADDRCPLDLVIANAGLSGGTSRTGANRTGASHAGESAEQTRRLFDVNVGGVLNTVLPATECLRARGRGHIGLVASIAGFRGLPGAPAYCASKAAIKVWGEGLRGSLAEDGIGVSVILPGFVESNITATNTFPMPFLMKAGRAARLIRTGLERNHGRIAFPWPMVAMAWLFSLLPDAAMGWIGKKLPRK